MLNKYRHLLLASFVIVCSVAFINAYIFNLRGATVDAERFLDAAKEWAHWGTFQFVVDSTFFIQFLGTLIYMFNLDEFGLTFLGILFYYFSIAFLLRKFWNTPSRNKAAFWVIWYFILFSPSLILRVGALMREPYLIFAVVMMCYQGVKFIESRSLYRLLLSMAFGVIASFFHKAGLVFFPVFLLALSVFCFQKQMKSIPILALIALSLFVLTEFMFPNVYILRGGAALEALMTGNTTSVERILDYKSGRDFRTTYNYTKDYSGIIGLLGTAIRANAYYYFSPLPWQISNASDVFAFTENLLRVLLIGFLLTRIAFYKGRSSSFVLLCYFLLNTIWAIGTSNYGTATRHHLVGMPLLLYCLFLLQGTKQYPSAHRPFPLKRDP